MKQCPRCGKKFNFLQRAVGEDKEHVSRCTTPEERKDLSYIAEFCRGCPAGCFEKIEYEEGIAGQTSANSP